MAKAQSPAAQQMCPDLGPPPGIFDQPEPPKADRLTHQHAHAAQLANHRPAGERVWPNGSNVGYGCCVVWLPRRWPPSFRTRLSSSEWPTTTAIEKQMTLLRSVWLAWLCKFVSLRCARIGSSSFFCCNTRVILPCSVSAAADGPP